MVNMSVGENYQVDAIRIKGKVSVLFKRDLAPALIQSAIQQNLLAVVMHHVHRTGDCLCRTPKLNFHWRWNSCWVMGRSVGVDFARLCTKSFGWSDLDPFNVFTCPSVDTDHIAFIDKNGCLKTRHPFRPSQVYEHLLTCHPWHQVHKIQLSDLHGWVAS